MPGAVGRMPVPLDVRLAILMDGLSIARDQRLSIEREGERFLEQIVTSNSLSRL